MSSITQHAYKVGAIVLRETSPQHYSVLVCQPKPNPKNPEDIKRLGLVRGTRMFWNGEEWEDVPRDGLTAPEDISKLEPVTATLLREMEEEASITSALLQKQRIYELGAWVFPSSSKEPYPIHWFVVVLDGAAASQLPLQGHQDSAYTQWSTLEQMQQYVAEGRMTPGYVDIAQQAIAGIAKGVLKPIVL